jgi:hypothetical protein
VALAVIALLGGIALAVWGWVGFTDELAENNEIAALFAGIALFFGGLIALRRMS